MIISHKYRFIFIKNRKVAGTSIEKALGQICGPDDIVTSDTPEKRRVNDKDGLIEFARNYKGSFFPAKEILLDPNPISVARTVRDFSTRHKFYNHMKASSVKARVPNEVWQNYYKFCFERNPWDKMVSFYYWFNRKNPNKCELNEFINLKSGLLTTSDQRYPIDWGRYTLNNRIILDDVFDYSNLESGLKTALEKAGVPDDVIQSVNIPRMKSHTREATGPSLSAKSDKKIQRLFQKEITHFGYTCPFNIQS